MRTSYYQNDEIEKIRQLYEIGYPFAVRKLDFTPESPKKFLDQLLPYLEIDRHVYSPAVLVSRFAPFASYGGHWENFSGLVFSPHSVQGFYKRHAATLNISGSDPNRFKTPLQKRLGGNYYENTDPENPLFYYKALETFARYFNQKIDKPTKEFLREFLNDQKYDPHNNDKLKEYLQDQAYPDYIFYQITSKYGSLDTFDHNTKCLHQQQKPRCSHDRKSLDQWWVKKEPPPNEVMTKPCLFIKRDSERHFNPPHIKDKLTLLSLQQQIFEQFGDILGVYCNPNTPETSVYIFSLFILMGLRPILFEYNDSQDYDPAGTPRLLSAVEKPKGWRIDIHLDEPSLYAQAKIIVYSQISIENASLLTRILENSWRKITRITQLIRLDQFEKYIPKLNGTLDYNKEDFSLLGTIAFLLMSNKSEKIPDAVQDFLNQYDFSIEEENALYLIYFLLTIFPEHIIPQSLKEAIKTANTFDGTGKNTIARIWRRCSNHPPYHTLMLRFLWQEKKIKLFNLQFNLGVNKKWAFSYSHLAENFSDGVIQNQLWELANLLVLYEKNLEWSAQVIFLMLPNIHFPNKPFEIFLQNLIGTETLLKKSSQTLLKAHEISFEEYACFLQHSLPLTQTYAQSVLLVFLSYLHVRSLDFIDYLTHFIKRDEEMRIHWMNYFVVCQRNPDITIENFELLPELEKIVEESIAQGWHYAADNLAALLPNMNGAKIKAPDIRNSRGQTLWNTLYLLPKEASLINDSHVLIRLFEIYYQCHCPLLRKFLHTDFLSLLLKEENDESKRDKIFQHAKENPNSRTNATLTFIYHANGNEKSMGLIGSDYEYSKVKNALLLWNTTHPSTRLPVNDC